MTTTSYAIGLGSNRRHRRHGAPARVIAAALDALAHEGITIVAVSPTIATPALGPAGRRFANAAAIVASERPPLEMLTLLKRIERAFGRRGGRRWGARVLDLDILLWNGGIVARRTLSIPHPGLASRAFALGPLAAIAPIWRVPRTGVTVRQLAARLPVDPPRPRP